MRKEINHPTFIKYIIRVVSKWFTLPTKTKITKIVYKVCHLSMMNNIMSTFMIDINYETELILNATEWSIILSTQSSRKVLVCRSKPAKFHSD